MPRRKKPSQLPPASTVPTIYEATLGAAGAIIKGQLITQVEAELRRKVGRDVVVCGPGLSSNRGLAGEIERNANVTAKRCPPHSSSGPNALPHYQPDPRPPAGHTFYETPHRKAL